MTTHWYNRLYVRLAAILLVLFALLGVTLFLVVRIFDTMYMEEISQRTNRDLAMYLAREHRSIGDQVLDASAIVDLFPYVSAVNPVVEAYVLDADGTVRAASSVSHAPMRVVDLQPVREFIAGNRAMPIYGTDPRSDRSARTVFSAAPIGDAIAPLGYVYVVLGRSDVATAAMSSSRGYALRLGGVVVIGSLLFVLIAALLLFRALTTPLLRLTEAVEQFRALGFTQSLPLEMSARAADEISRLRQVFAEIAERMVMLLQQLRANDESRRNAVLNASHDLRTPLAALQGYLQTLLLKYEDLDDDERRRYLGTAERHAERLTGLVDQMFELARLDAAEAAPRYEAFAPSELISDIGQKYQLQAEQQRIALMTELSRAPDTMHADIAMIEQMMEKLIENALRFTRPGGSITLGVTRLAERIVFSVIDTGTGIEPDVLPRIFERFYSVGAAGRERSSGLGLAIVKRIAELHGASAEAASTPAVGTQFYLSFPVEPPIAST